jgi:hypothetical protein
MLEMPINPIIYSIFITYKYDNRIEEGLHCADHPTAQLDEAACQFDRKM